MNQIVKMIFMGVLFFSLSSMAELRDFRYERGHGRSPGGHHSPPPHHRRPYYPPHHGGVWFPPPPPPYYGHPPVVYAPVVCAPQVEKANIAVTQDVLFALSESNDFQTADQFKAQVTALSEMKDLVSKRNAMLAMLNINGDDYSAIYALASIRSDADIKAEWVEALKVNASLSETQTFLVIKSLNQALTGELK